MKLEFGGQFISKIEGMVKDMVIAHEQAIDACLIRIMKSQKQLLHQQLASNVLSSGFQMFKFNIEIIKKQMEDLGSSEFLECHNETPTYLII